MQQRWLEEAGEGELIEPDKVCYHPYIAMVQTHRLSPCQHVRGEGVAEPFLYAITSTGRF